MNPGNLFHSNRMFCFGFNTLPLSYHLNSRLPFLRQALPRSHSITLCTAADINSKKRVVFLGTPSVAASALEKITNVSSSSDSSFQVVGVVTQPPTPAGRKRTVRKSPVHEMAESLQIPNVLIPPSASDPEFLDRLYNLKPDLCITAAYGHFLPSRFLSCPSYGTLNIHPSLLPKFRGAAPVQRALEADVDKTGVSILFTVKKMDAGPIVSARERILDGTEKTPELLVELLNEGVEALLEVLPSVWNESVQKVEQDHDEATYAPKISKEEGRLSFTENAHIVDAKVRAFYGWPGTWGDFVLKGDKGTEEVRLKVLETQVLRSNGGMCVGIHQVSYNDEHNCLEITCGDGSRIGILKIQLPGKTPMDARSFWNGLRGKTIERKRLPH